MIVLMIFASDYCTDIFGLCWLCI